MWVRYLDRALRSFTLLSVLLVSIFLSVLIIFGYIYIYSTKNTYEFILLIVALTIIIITLFFILDMLVVFYAYKKGTVNRYLNWLVRLGLKAMLPIIIVLSGILKKDKDIIRKFYVDINNILIESMDNKYKSEQVLILLPHCLQNSVCTYKITNNIHNCVRCGKCTIGDIIEVSQEFGVEVTVVTGGTAARNTVKKIKPKLILSVACERDLTSGIADVGNIPVIGLINQRPNGPCYNTTIDVGALKDKLEDIISC